jgi:hypothetical protein
VQPDAVAHVAVDDDRPALDHADRQPPVNLSFDRVELHDIEDERLAGRGRLPADASPLVRTILLHQYVREEPERASGWFGKLESLVATSIGHVPELSNGHAAAGRNDEKGISEVLPERMRAVI